MREALLMWEVRPLRFLLRSLQGLGGWRRYILAAAAGASSTPAFAPFRCLQGRAGCLRIRNRRGNPFHIMRSRVESRPFHARSPLDAGSSSSPFSSPISAGAASRSLQHSGFRAFPLPARQSRMSAHPKPSRAIRSTSALQGGITTLSCEKPS